MTNKAVEYAEAVANGQIEAPKYVKKQMGEIVRIAKDEDAEFILSEKSIRKSAKF